MEQEARVPGFSYLAYDGEGRASWSRAKPLAVWRISPDAGKYGLGVTATPTNYVLNCRVGVVDLGLTIMNRAHQFSRTTGFLDHGLELDLA